VTRDIAVCILNDTRIDRHHGCERVMGALESLVAGQGLRISATCPAHVDWRQDAAFLRALDAARLVIVNGEGTLHHDRPEARILLEIGRHSRARGVPAVLVNAGWESNGPELCALARDFVLVSARDRRSAEELRAHGVDCRVVPDLSLYEPIAVPAASAASGLPAFTDSVDRFAAIALERCRREVGGTTLSIMFPDAGIGGYLKFLRAGFAARDVARPAAFMRIVRMRHRLWRAASPRTAEFIAQLARASLLVSGRFHACTLALLTRTPFVALPSNTGKIAQLVADAGLDGWRNQAELTPRFMAEASRRGWSAREEASIADYVATMRLAAQSLFRDVRALA